MGKKIGYIIAGDEVPESPNGLQRSLLSLEEITPEKLESLMLLLPEYAPTL
jgi:hypothetical protein